jgi:transcriptional regulator with XRE-family HTH domain
MRSHQTSVKSVMEAFVDKRSERVARDIRKLRWSRGLTQQELADGLNISLLEMEYIESGYCRVADETLVAIRQFLGVTVSSA